MLSNKLILQGDGRVSVINKKGANIEMLAPMEPDDSVVENAEAAARKDRRNVAPAETQRSVRTERRIRQQMRLVAVRINRIHRQVVGEHRVVGRERRGDHFIKPNAGPNQTPVKSPDESGGISHVRTVKQGGLLHRPANFAAAHQFSEVAKAASELLFESKTLIRAGAAVSEEDQNRSGRQKGN